MATVHFAPSSAIKYVGAKSKEFHLSVARPKPMLKRGDIIIVDKKTAFNLVQKGFEEFVMVDEIKFNKDAAESAKVIEALEAENEALRERIKMIEAMLPPKNPPADDLHKEDDSANTDTDGANGDAVQGVDSEGGEI